MITRFGPWQRRAALSGRITPCRPLRKEVDCEEKSARQETEALNSEKPGPAIAGAKLETRPASTGAGRTAEPHE